MVKPNKALNHAILEVVDNQIRSLNPPATKETFNRLVGEGVTESEARCLIGCIVASEIFDTLRHNQPYNEERYVSAFKKLPDLPE